MPDTLLLLLRAAQLGKIQCEASLGTFGISVVFLSSKNTPLLKYHLIHLSSPALKLYVNSICKGSLEYLKAANSQRKSPIFRAPHPCYTYGGIDHFSWESNSYPFFLGNEDLSNYLPHRGKVYVQISHLLLCYSQPAPSITRVTNPPARRIAGRREPLGPYLDPPTIPCWLSEDVKYHQGANQPGKIICSAVNLGLLKAP